MKRTKVFLILITTSILLFFTQCKKISIEEDINDITFQINFNDSDEFEWPENLVVEEIIYLSTVQDYLVTSVDKLFVSNNSEIIALLDKKQLKVFLFDKEGNPIGVLNKNGSGPDQYLDASDFIIDYEAETIEILDYKAIKSYNLVDFTFLGSVDLSSIESDQNFRYFTKIDKIYFLWTNIPPYQIKGKKSDKEVFHFIKKNGSDIEYFIPKEYGIIGDQRIYPTGIQGQFNLSPTLGSNLIFGFNQKGVFKKYHFPFEKNSLPKSLLENFLGNEMELINSDYYKLISNIRETNDHLYFHFIGKERKLFHVLFDTHHKKFISIGHTNELFPNIIFSDKDYFYCYILPGFLINYLNRNKQFSDHPILKNVDLARLDKYDNPIIIKFRI
jgi:hypothetical protein